MFRANTHKKPLRYVTIHRRFAYHRFARAIALYLSAHSGGRKPVHANPFFDITHKLIIVAEFQRCAVGSHIYTVFFFRDVRTISRNILVMPFAQPIGITIPLIGVLAALYFVVNRRKANAELCGNLLFAQSRFQEGFEL